MYNCALLKFRQIGSKSNEGFGMLTPIEAGKDIPFDIKRIYYIYDVNDNIIRGKHSHKKLHQVLICMNGSIDIRLENYFGEESYTLNDPSIGLYVGPDNWREMSNFTDNGILLVFASDQYDETDYIRDYDEFIKYSDQKYGSAKTLKLQRGDR